MEATAYEFFSERSLEEVADALTAQGPWAWSLRESHWYGDYLNCRPTAAVRIRIHEPAQFNRSKAPHFVNQPAGLRRYISQVDVEQSIDRAPFDTTFLDLLTWLEARDVHSIPIYD